MARRPLTLDDHFAAELERAKLDYRRAAEEVRHSDSIFLQFLMSIYPPQAPYTIYDMMGEMTLLGIDSTLAMLPGAWKA